MAHPFVHAAVGVGRHHTGNFFIAPQAMCFQVRDHVQRIWQHLTGWAGFRNLELRVGPGVFVPRPETESVAGWAIDAARAAAGHRTLRRSKCGPGDAYCDVAGEEDEQAEARTARPPVVVDLCTGSGAIALSIKDEVPAAKVYAVELSPEAHAWALANRDRLGLEVEIRLGDAITAFGDLEGAVDVVVSNPPYIPTGVVPVDPEVRPRSTTGALRRERGRPGDSAPGGCARGPPATPWRRAGHGTRRHPG